MMGPVEDWWETFRQRWGIQTPDEDRFLTMVVDDPRVFPPLGRAYESCMQRCAFATEVRGDDAFGLLTAIMQAIEAEMAKILRQHTRFFWFETCRSVGHDALFYTRMPAQFYSLFVSWCENVSLAASLKYGQSGMWDIEDTGTGLIVRRSLADLVDLKGLQALVIEFQKLQQYRIAVGNGAILQTANGEVRLVRERHEELAGSLYNRRASAHWKAMFGPLGIAEQNVTPEMPGYINMVATSPTITGSLSVFPRGEQRLGPFKVLDTWFDDLRYIPFGINLAPLFNHLRLLEREVGTSLRLSPGEVVAGLWAIDRMVISWVLEAPWRRRQFVMDGWIAFVPHVARLEVARRYPQCFRDLTGRTYLGDPMATTRRLFALVSIAEKDCARIRVDLARPVGCFFHFGDKLVYDSISVAWALHQLVEQVQTTPVSKNIKSAAFEDEARQLLAAALGDSVTFPYPARKKFHQSGRAVVEIDASVQKQNLLFLIECKAFSYTHELQVGQPRAVRNRWSYTEEWLRQVNAKADTVRQIAEAQPILPPDVSLLVPVVCTPWVEMIHELEERYMLDENTPRICTPTELARFIATCDPNVLAAKPWVVAVA